MHILKSVVTGCIILLAGLSVVPVLGPVLIIPLLLKLTGGEQ